MNNDTQKGTARSPVLSIFLPTAAGLLAGLIAAMTWTTTHAELPRNEIRITPALAPVASEVGGNRFPSVAERLRREHEGALLEAERLQASGEPPAENRPAEQEPHARSPEEYLELRERAREARAADFREKVARHDAQEVDRSWADRAARDVEATLLPHAEGLEGDIERVDCRSQSCAVTVRWPNYRAAMEHAGSLVQIPMTPNCGRGIHLFDPADEDAPYTATMLVECYDAQHRGYGLW